jgi:mannose-6-phosphate isomerase-like protein (cupin superfamily)
MAYKQIEHVHERTTYTPPGHAGTTNERLVAQDFCGTFEMLRGVVEPGGEAEPHHHDTEHQIIYLLQGEADVTLGDDAPVRCTAGSIVRIPPKLRHRVVNVGTEPLETIVIYSPPIAPHV